VLHLSERTVAHDLLSVLRKTGCANRTQSATYAFRHGIAEP
jgi:DNA-binding NarL/FixJ family response regulator